MVPWSVALALTLAAPPPTALPIQALREHAEPAPDLPPEPEEGPEPGSVGQPVAKENYRMVVIGDVLIGVGMGGFGLMVAGLAVRSSGKSEYERLVLNEDATQENLDEAKARQELGLKLTLAGAGVTTALLAAGITLVAVGSRRERLRRASLEASWWGTGPQPWVLGPRGGRSVGANWGWRF